MSGRSASTQLHVALAYGDPFTTGGVQSQVAGRLNHLGTPDGPVRYTLFTRVAPPKNSPWPHVTTVQFSGWNRGSIAVAEYTSSYSLARHLAAVHRRDPFDLVELHAGGLGPVVVAWTNRAEVPCLYVSHSLQCFGPRPPGIRWDAARYYAWSNRRTARLCTRVVAVSRALKQEWLKQGFPDDLIEVQHTATDAANSATDCNAAVRAEGRPLQVLFVGRISHEKGLDLLIEAVAACSNRMPVPPHLSVVGAISQDHPLVESVRQRQLPVTFLGGRSNAEVRALMAQADLVVIPSRYDACPLVAIEALQAGALIVATRAGGLPELIHDGETGLLVPSDDIPTLTDVLVRIARNPTVWGGMREAAKTAGRKFLWSNRAPQILDLYQRLLVRAR